MSAGRSNMTCKRRQAAGQLTVEWGRGGGVTQGEHVNSSVRDPGFNKLCIRIL